MTLHGLRLLVALLTFAVGTAAAWLLNFESPTRSEILVVESEPALVLDAPPRDEPRGSCSYNKSRVVSGGILQGKAVSKPQPVYPPAAKAAGVGGTVVVQIIVGEDGMVFQAKAVSGPDMLREAAENAARAARFSPTLLSGEPVKVSGVITYNFVLN